MAGQLTENEIFNFCDYSAGYISLVLGRCALISLAVFGLALLLRGAFLKGCCFRRDVGVVGCSLHRTLVDSPRVFGRSNAWRRIDVEAPPEAFRSGSGDGEEDVLRAAGVSERASRDALFRRASLP